MSDERRSSAINTRKRSDFFHFDRCFKFLDHNIFTLSFKGNGRLYSTKVRELRKTGNDYFEKKIGISTKTVNMYVMGVFSM